MSTAALTDVASDVPIPGCYWALISDYDAWVIIGATWPYGSDNGWMKSSSTHGETRGVAASSAGSYGTCSIDTNWDTAHTLYYKLAADGRVCGDNNVPSLASRVRTSR